MRVLRSLGVALFLGGCGTMVPDIQEFPGDSVDGQLIVKSIVESIHCELRNSITHVIDEDRRLAEFQGFRVADWLDSWAVQIGLTLTIEEKSSVSPSAVWTPDPLTALLSLSSGGSLSGTATRTNTLDFYYTVAELYRLGECVDPLPVESPFGSLLVRNDLKLSEWLLAQVLVVGTGLATVPISTGTPLRRNAMSHQIKFTVAASGSIDPVWIISEVVLNRGGSPLFSTSRSTTHDLVMTFGPHDPAADGNLVGAAYANFLATRIAIANDE